MAESAKVFLITGASSGIGEATARHAAAAGYQVVLAARSTEKLEALAAELGGLAVTCDVTEWSDQEAMVERTLAEYGRIDVAFANAGFGAGAELQGLDAGALARHGPDERPRRRVHDPGDDGRARRDARGTCS